MNRRELVSAVALTPLFVLAGLWANASEGADARVAEFVVFAGGEPTRRLAIEVTVDDDSVPQRWQRTFAELFEFHDRDSDGVLSNQEAARLPAPFSLRQIVWNPVSPVAGRIADPVLLDVNRDGAISRKEMTTFYQQAEVGEVVIGAGVCRSNARLTEPLQGLLGGLTKNPDASGQHDFLIRRLGEVDLNNDQWLSARELGARVSYPGSTCTVRWRTDQPRGRQDSTIQALPLRLAKNVDGATAPASLATRTITVRFTGVDPELAKPVGPSPVSRNSALWIDLGTDRGRLGEMTRRAQRRIRQSFAKHDANRDESLSVSETKPNDASLVRGLLSIADRDGNQTVDRSELDRWLALQRALTQPQVTISILDFQNGLFASLDDDLDGHLSLREMRAVRNRADSRRKPSAEKLDVDRAPRRILIVVSHGQPRSFLCSTVSRGPGWFRAMDRNGDRDVSRGEFLGPTSAFEQLDSDDDHLISVAEAAEVE